MMIQIVIVKILAKLTLCVMMPGILLFEFLPEAIFGFSFREYVEEHSKSKTEYEFVHVLYFFVGYIIWLYILNFFGLI